MQGIRKQRVFVGDFETTVFKGQEFTEVWASALVELNTEDVFICGSIEEHSFQRSYGSSTSLCALS